MADKYQTQCPHCGVKFQITAQQLALANGTVRCGSCLQVFQANQNIVPIGEATAPAGSARPSARASARPSQNVPTATTAPKPAARQPQPTRPAATPPPVSEGIDDDLADMILRELDTAPAAPPAKPQAEPSWGAAVPPPAAATATPAIPQWTVPPPTASNAQKYGIEENKTRIAVGGELNDALMRDDPFGAAMPASTAHIVKEGTADESWTKALLGEGDEKDKRLEKFKISAEELSIADKTGVQARGGLAARLHEMAHNEKDRESAPVSRTPSAGTFEDDELDFLNEPGLTMQDVELPTLGADDTLSPMALGGRQVNFGREVFWGTLTVVFALVLFVQYLVYNFDTLSRDDSWRNLYSGACGALGCKLPSHSDVSRIQGANLVIRSHPTVASALVVDAIVYNRAPFDQPFPLLEISFTDLQGNNVAGRVFKPEEYLQGELKGAKSMPADTPIHLSLELVDPGAGASNYEIRFLAPPAA